MHLMSQRLECQTRICEWNASQHTRKRKRVRSPPSANQDSRELEVAAFHRSHNKNEISLRLHYGRDNGVLTAVKDAEKGPKAIKCL